jgi:CBS domain-containing protein
MLAPLSQGGSTMAYRCLSEIIFRRDPVILPETATVLTACRQMKEQGIGAILVCNEAGRLTGIFTGRDAVCRIVAEARDPHHTTLAQAMTADPDILAPGQSAIEALRLMHDGGFRHIPVVDGGRVVGIVSRRDFTGIEIDRLDEESALWERI